MTVNHDLLHVRIPGAVIKPFDQLIEDLKRGDRGSVPGVLIVGSGRPLRASPDQCIGHGPATGLETISPWIGYVLVVTIGEEGGNDLNRLEVDIGVVGSCLRKCAEHVAHVGTGITVETMDDDNSTLDVRVDEALSVAILRPVIDECECIVLASRVSDTPVGKL